MQVKRWLMTRVLLNRFYRKTPEPLIRCLPKEDAEGILAQNIISDNIALVMAQPEELIQKIHYSWLAPIIQSFPQFLQVSMLGAMPKTLSDKLQKMLNLNINYVLNTSLAAPVQTFLINKLYSHVKDTAVLPLSFLPTTPLTRLGELNKNQLVTLIDLLGIYDLADEVRQIIDKDRLKKIYGCLGIKQRQFLRVCLHQKEVVASSPLGLGQWDGECSQLEKLLHTRGMMRLGKALCIEHPDFLWHLTHTLDTGRGTRLMSYYAPNTVSKITPALVQQVINLLNFLSPKSKS